MGMDIPTRQAIEKHIAEFLTANDSNLQWIKAVVNEHNFLPLYIGWVSTFGIRPDGSFIRMDEDGPSKNIQPLQDSFWQRMAICQGVKKYPELESLLPVKPAEAVTCGACGGSGQLGSDPKYVCECGGTGWVLPGEDVGPSPG